MRAGKATDHVVVVGGGVIGLAVAWRAASIGLPVTVVDPEPGRGASWAAAGMLAPVTEVHYGEEALLELNLAANHRWPSFADELESAASSPSGYLACGTLIVARDVDDRAALEDLVAFQTKLGLDVEWLRGRDARTLEPGLAPRTRAAVSVPDDHQVDNRALVEALLVAAQRAGATLRREAVAHVEVETGAVRGVRLAGGERLDAGHVVLAAGCDSGRIDGLPPDAVPPVRPVKGQLLHLRGPVGPDGSPPLASRTIRGLDVYVVSRADGRVVIGATVEERGFDTTVTAGAVHDLLRDAWELLPGVSELELVEVAAGLRPGTPDNAPLIGPGALDGLVVATGHYRNGILLAPVTADAVTELLVTGRTPDLVVPFDPRRFPRGEPWRT